jgi:hypothetical protein
LQGDENVTAQTRRALIWLGLAVLAGAVVAAVLLWPESVQYDPDTGLAIPDLMT